MPRYPEAQALAETAIRHILSEQDKLLKRPDASDLLPVVRKLAELAKATSVFLTEGASDHKSAASLKRNAKSLEKAADKLSDKLWKHIPVSVSTLYEQIETAMHPPTGMFSFAKNIRQHYHNLRLRLLEQTISARMLVSNSDLGDEVERIWQQFLEYHLGPNYRVLRGGHVCDHQGNKSSQLDLIITPADAHVFVPSDTPAGKAQVLVDQVLAVAMVTANLTTKKFTEDWQKLQSLPGFADKSKDYPGLKEHPWPLCYILSAQSDPIEKLKEQWVNVCEKGMTSVVPQFVITLDSGYIYCGLRRWPCPRFPSNYVTATDVNAETGLFAGIGLAWLITQLQGRLAVIQHRALGSVQRLAGVLNDAMLRSANSAADSRFRMPFDMGPIAGVLEWGRFWTWANNKVQLCSLARRHADDTLWEIALRGREILPRKIMDMKNCRPRLRWFLHEKCQVSGRLLVVEEWLNYSSKADHRSKITAFDTITGKEIRGDLVSRLRSEIDIMEVRVAIEKGLPPVDKKADKFEQT